MFDWVVIGAQTATSSSPYEGQQLVDAVRVRLNEFVIIAPYEGQQPMVEDAELPAVDVIIAPTRGNNTRKSAGRSPAPMRHHRAWGWSRGTVGVIGELAVLPTRVGWSRHRLELVVNELVLLTRVGVVPGLDRGSLAGHVLPARMGVVPCSPARPRAWSECSPRARGGPPTVAAQAPRSPCSPRAWGWSAQRDQLSATPRTCPHARGGEQLGGPGDLHACRVRFRPLERY
jgi:hypothetical protein